MNAFAVLVAVIVGARVFIHAVERRPRLAGAAEASIPERARVAVGATGALGGLVNATGSGRAAVLAAAVVIVATDRWSRDAAAGFARIVVGTGVAVATAQEVVHVHAAAFASVRGARVVVAAVEHVAAHAAAAQAAVGLRAAVAV